jgi:hypothetical protein
MVVVSWWAGAAKHTANRPVPPESVRRPGGLPRVRDRGPGGRIAAWWPPGGGQATCPVWAATTREQHPYWRTYGGGRATAPLLTWPGDRAVPRVYGGSPAACRGGVLAAHTDCPPCVARGQAVNHTPGEFGHTGSLPRLPSCATLKSRWLRYAHGSRNSLQRRPRSAETWGVRASGGSIS